MPSAAAEGAVSKILMRRRNMIAKIFVVSDVHGHAGILREALEAAGFDPANENHLLVSCGDHFDRGSENAATLDYLESLPNKVLIRGNHEEMLKELLQRGYIEFNDIRNGVGNTVNEFFKAEEISDGGMLRGGAAAKARLLKFIDGTVDYFETKNYIFVHGWIPLAQDEKWRLYYDDNWRTSCKESFEMSRWMNWNELYRYGLRPEDKTLVCGHRAAMFAGEFDYTRGRHCYDPFYGDGVIAIDTLTVESKRINVLVIEDELIEPKIHRIAVPKTQFDRVVSEKKKVELLPFDQKTRSMRSGDFIKVTCEDGENEATVRIKAVYSYPDVYDAVESFKQSEMGFSGKSRDHIADYLTRIYGEESLRKQGVAAVCFELS